MWKIVWKKNPSIQWHQTKLHERTMPIIISIIQSKNPSKYGHNHSFFAWTQSIPFFHVWNLYTTQSFLANKNIKPHVTLKKRFVNKNLEAEQKRKKELTSFFVHLLWIQDQLFALYPLLPLWEWTKSKRTQAASPQTFTTHKRKDQKDYSLGHPRTKSREEKKGEEEELPVTPILLNTPLSFFWWFFFRNITKLYEFCNDTYFLSVRLRNLTDHVFTLF